MEWVPGVEAQIINPTESYFVQDVCFIFKCCWIWMWYLCMKLAQYNGYLVSTVDTDDLVLWHQVISSHSAEYTSMHFQLFMG